MTAENKPLYLKIEESVRDDIMKGRYKPGDLLPTEEDFTKIYSASRTTVRNALANLEKHGYVWRKQGKGSVVKDIKSAQNLNYLSSLTEALETEGKSVTTGMMSISEVSPPRKVKDEIDIPDGEKVYCLQRTRIADNIPIAYVNNYILKSITPDFESKKELLEIHGLYNVLESEYKLEIDSCVETINTYISGPMEMEILQLEKEQALFLSKRITRLVDGRVFEYVTSVIRGDMHQYTVFLKDRMPTD
jgi:GntR family transcriptional regulator